MATTVNMASDLTSGVYKSTGVSCTNNRCTIPLTWANLNGYPELIVETAVEDVEASYHPAKIVDEYGCLVPIKYRFLDETTSIDGEIITVDGIYGTAPYARIVIYGGDCTVGTIVFTIDAG